MLFAQPCLEAYSALTRVWIHILYLLKRMIYQLNSSLAECFYSLWLYSRMWIWVPYFSKEARFIERGKYKLQLGNKYWSKILLWKYGFAIKCVRYRQGLVLFAFTQITNLYLRILKIDRHNKFGSRLKVDLTEIAKLTAVRGSKWRM